MPHQMDVFSLFIDQLADAVAQRLNGGRQPKSASAAAPAAAGGRRKKGAKRSSAEIAGTTSALLAYITANKGLRIEQIAKAMRVSTSDLKLPAQNLLGDKLVKTKGQKRGTQYFA